MVSNGWRVLDLTNFEGDLRYQRGKVLVSSKSDDPYPVALSDLAVILIGSRVGVSGAVLSKLSEYDIALFSCDWRGVPLAALYPSWSHSRIAARHLAQANLSVPRQKQAWAQIVRAKILGQADTLREIDSSTARKLRELAGQVKSGDPDNREAVAAKIYWGALFKDLRFRRLPGGGEGGRNSCLDYAYTILRGYGIRAVSAAGLSGPLGVNHCQRGNAFALVDDLIEPFRPAVDFYLVSSGFPLDLSLSDTKKALVGCVSAPFFRGLSIPSSIIDFAQHFGRYVEGEVEKLTPPVWKGQC